MQQKQIKETSQLSLLIYQYADYTLTILFNSTISRG